MKTIKEMLGNYRDVASAARVLEVTPTQLHRFVKYGCLVDSNGVIYKPQTTIKGLRYEVQ